MKKKFLVLSQKTLTDLKTNFTKFKLLLPSDSKIWKFRFSLKRLFSFRNFSNKCRPTFQKLIFCHNNGKTAALKKEENCWLWTAICWKWQDVKSSILLWMYILGFFQHFGQQWKTWLGCPKLGETAVMW